MCLNPSTRTCAGFVISQQAISAMKGCGWWFSPQMVRADHFEKDPAYPFLRSYLEHPRNVHLMPRS